ncbi:MAG: hypothetical protein CME29_06195 [Gemmatimonadetes bacterium]|nr:hypothetical protein [Gemmatimonadota bacterium]
MIHCIRPGLLSSLGLCLLVIGSCESDRSSVNEESPAEESPVSTDLPETIEIILADFYIGMPAILPAGDLTLRLASEGVEEHNLIFVRNDTEQTVWETDGRLSPFEVRTVELNLPAGEYTAVCDFSGHEMRGMFFDFTVSQ